MSVILSLIGIGSLVLAFMLAWIADKKQYKKKRKEKKRKHKRL